MVPCSHSRKRYNARYNTIVTIAYYLMVLISAGTNFRESKINAFRGYLPSQINTDFFADLFVLR